MASNKIKRSLLKARQCGTCNACCTTHGVSELRKPAFLKCEKLSPVKGCGIYETRPQSCRDFACLWLQGKFEGEYRPDRLGMVLAANEPPQGLPQVITAHVLDERFLSEYTAKMFLEHYSKFFGILLCLPDGRRKMVGPAEVINAYVRFVKRTDDY